MNLPATAGAGTGLDPISEARGLRGSRTLQSGQTWADPLISFTLVVLNGILIRLGCATTQPLFRSTIDLRQPKELGITFLPMLNARLYDDIYRLEQVP